METRFDYEDRKILKEAFSDYPRTKVVVDIKKNEAYLIANGKKIADIEKRPDEWGIRLTAPLSIKFGMYEKDNKPHYYCVLYSIYEKVTVPLVENTKQFINFLNVRISISEKQYFTFNENKNAVSVSVIPGLDFEVPRHLWNKAVAFKRNINYHQINLTSST